MQEPVGTELAVAQPTEKPLSQQCLEDNPREVYYAVVERFCEPGSSRVEVAQELLQNFQTGTVNGPLRIPRLPFGHVARFPLSHAVARCPPRHCVLLVSSCT